MTSEGDVSTEPARILIVDAYGHSREGLRASLRGGGCVVETAAGSWETISKMREGRFRAAIIDLELPPAHGVSGWDLARVFRAFQPAAAIILVTAEWRPEFREEARRLQRAQLLEKPINPAELRAIVRTLHAELEAPDTASNSR